MPNTSSAKKALRVSERKHERNLVRKQALKQTVKKFRKTAAGGDVNAAQAALHEVYTVADKIAKTGYIKKNRAARIKSRNAKFLASRTGKTAKSE